MFRMESSTLWPPLRTPIAAGTDTVVARLSMRVRTTVPSRSEAPNAIRPREGPNRTMSSSARLRPHHASRSALTLRQARLTTSFETAPSKSAKRARLTRRVFVPDS